MSENKDFYVKKVEQNQDTNITANVIFAIAGFVLAGVAFGIGDQIFSGPSMQYLTAFGGVGITSANIKSMREKLALKKQNNNSKGRK